MLNFGEILIYVASFISIYTTIYFLLVLKENRKNLYHKPTKTLDKDLPSVTIVVPAYNEEKTLAGTVESLLELDYPKDKLNIVIVDDGSKDNTAKIARRYESKGVIFYSKPNGGKHTALNYVLQRCQTDLFGALDADSYVDKQALRRIVALFKNKKVMAVTPSMKIYEPRTVYEHIQRIEFLIGIFLRKIFAFIGSIHVTPGPFSIYKKEFFDKHGYYVKAHQTEDIEVALRIQSKNYEVENSLDAYVYTHAPKKFVSLKKQRVRWYRGFLENVIDYKELFSKKHGNLGLFVLPMSFISVALVILVALYTIYILGKNTFEWFMNAKAINFDILKLEWFRLDLFFINMSSTAILGFIGIGITLSLVFIIRVLSKEKKIVKSYVYFFLFYWILFAYWWATAGINKLRKKTNKWGHKSE